MNVILPKGWTYICLKEAGKYINGRAFKPAEWETEGLPIIRIQNLNNPNAKYNYSKKQFEEKFKVQSGDLLVAWSASLGVFRWNNGKAWLNQHIFRVEPNYNIITKPFLYYALKEAIAYLYNKAHGTGMVHVTKPVFEAHNIPLPPLNEQKWIAAKLDKIMPRVDAVKERLERIPLLVKRFRQAVLTAAVTGKLTEKWREEHPDTESAENIIDSIKEERIAEAKTKIQLKKIEDLYDIIGKKDSKELPDKWKYTFLNKLCETFQYGTSCKSQKKGKIPVLRMGNLQNGFIDWNDLVYTSDEKEIEKYNLKSGDVLFNRTNSADLVGKTSIYLGEHPAIYAGYLIKINNYDKLDSKYLNYALNSQYAKEFCKRVKSDGVNQSNINAQKLGKFEIPLPPLEEQKEIVRQVDKLFAFADKLEAHYQKAKEKILKLPQSILAKAFRGELVPQDPGEESAHILLEKIKAQKENKQKLLQGVQPRGAGSQ